MGYRLFTDSHIDFLVENLPGNNFVSLTKLFNSTFGLCYSEERIKHALFYRKIKTRMPRGPNNPIGTEVLRSGYWWVKISNDRNIPYRQRYKQKHILLWEKTNGVIPKDHNIIFLDGNIKNCVIENLACMPKGLHGIMAILHLYSDNPEITKTGIKIAQLHLLVQKKLRKYLGEKEYKRQKHRKLYNNWYAKHKAKYKREKVPCLKINLNTGLMAGLNAHNLLAQRTSKAEREAGKKPITAGRGGKYYCQNKSHYGLF